MGDRNPVQYQCGTCNISFGSLDDVNRHPCDRDQNYQCIRCGQKFAKPEDADQHIGVCGDQDDADIKWSPDQEGALMQEMLAKYQTLVSLPTNKMKRKFWEDMAEKLGFDGRRWEEVRKKWNNVCLTYRRRKDLAGPRNSGRGATKPWIHYDVMDQILRDSPATEPAYAIATNVPADKRVSENKGAVLRAIENMPPAKTNQATTPQSKRKQPISPGTSQAITTPSNKRMQPSSPETSEGITYQQYLAEKRKHDARRADNDARRTEAIVSLVGCFKAAAEKENVSPHQKLVSLAVEFMKISNVMLMREGEMSVDQTVEVFRDVVSGLKRV